MDILFVGVFHKASNQHSILVIKFIRTADQKLVFALSDCYKLQPGQILSSIMIIDVNKLMFSYDSSKIMEITINSNELLNKQPFSRHFRKIKHSFSLFKVKAMTPLQDNYDLLVQDSKQQVCVFRQNKNRPEGVLQNKILMYPLQRQKKYVVLFDNNIFIVASSKFDQSKLEVFGIGQLSVEECIEFLLEEQKDALTAQLLIRSSGKGMHIFLEKQLKENNFGSHEKLKEYLKESSHTVESLLNVVHTYDITSSQSLGIFIDKMLELNQEELDPSNQLAYLMKCRLRHKMLDEFGLEINPKKFIFEMGIEEVITAILAQQSESKLEEAITKLFENLYFEVLEKYEECILCLPLSQLSSTFLLKYLPSGLASKKSHFWSNASLLLAPKQLQALSTNIRIYAEVSKELIEDAAQPNKALLILQDMIQHRKLFGLNQVALEAVEQTLVMDASPSRKERIGQLFGLDLPLQESLQAINGYFSNAKWIFVHDQKLYQGYIAELSDYIVNQVGTEGSPLLQNILNAHGNSMMLFLRDQDLVQLTLDVIYDRLSTRSTDQVEEFSNSMQNLAMSRNQKSFVQNVLTKHIELQKDIFGTYALEIDYKNLLQLQLNKDYDKLESMSNQIIETVISKSRKITEQVLAFSRKTTRGQIDSKWTQLLKNLANLTTALGYDDLDFQTLLLQKLLQNKLTSAVQQLIQQESVSIDRLVITIVAYMKEQYNLADETFFQFYPNATAFMELLLSKDPNNALIKQEMSLLETTLFLKENDMLSELPLIQIREDYKTSKLLDRVLQVNGFNQYPQQFDYLRNLAAKLGHDSSEVLVSVLQYLDQTRKIQNQHPEWLIKMIQELVIDKELPNINPIQKILITIAQTTKDQNFAKSLLKYLMTIINSETNVYRAVCQSIVDRLQQPANPSNNLIQLQSALDEDLSQRVQYLVKRLNQDYQLKDQELLLKIVNEGSFNYKQIKKLFQITGSDMSTKLKQLKAFKPQEIKKALTSEIFFEELVNGKDKAEESPLQKQHLIEAQVQSQVGGVKKLFLIKDQGELVDYLMKNYEDESDDHMAGLSTTKLQQSFIAEGIIGLNSKINAAILHILYHQQNTRDSQSVKEGELLREIVKHAPEINLLPLIRDIHKQSPIANEKNNSLLQGTVDQDQLELAKEFERVASDENLFGLLWNLEALSPSTALLKCTAGQYGIAHYFSLPIYQSRNSQGFNRR